MLSGKALAGFLVVQLQPWPLLARLAAPGLTPGTDLYYSQLLLPTLSPRLKCDNWRVPGGLCGGEGPAPETQDAPKRIGRLRCL